jgi:hypothetical protein
MIGEEEKNIFKSEQMRKNNKKRRKKTISEIAKHRDM